VKGKKAPHLAKMVDEDIKPPQRTMEAAAWMLRDKSV
jgi:hypothetical protein